MITGINSRVLLLAALAAVDTSAQTNAVVVGAGYQAPETLLRVSPGQLISLYITGVPARRVPGSATESFEERALRLSLPTVLAGLSVNIRILWLPLPQEIAAPIQAVYQRSVCGGSEAARCGMWTEIIVQIPYDLPVEVGTGVPPIPQYLIVRDGGQELTAIQTAGVPHSVHFLRSCDSVALPNPGLPCGPLVAHSDGTIVNPANPAKPGETLVAYALGLGRVVNPVRAGEAVKEANAVAGDIYLRFEYGDVPPAGMPERLAESAPRNISYAGLTPGYAGLYQLNFTVPPLPDSPVPCTRPAQENLTVTMSGVFTFGLGGRNVTSFDRIRLCVTPEN